MAVGGSYLDLLPGHGLQLTLLPQGELVLDHFGASGDGELEVLPVLHHLRHPFEVLPLLDEVIGQTWGTTRLRDSRMGARLGRETDVGAEDGADSPEA